MSKKLPPAASYMLAASLLVVALIAGMFLWQLGAPRQVAAPQSTTVSTGTADVGGSFSLVDQNGERRSDEDFRGRYMLVFFGFTYCPDVCPTTLAILKAALDEIGPLADEVTPILISVDPERDTPEMLKPYLSAFSPRYVGLTGTREEVDEAVRAYRAYYDIIESDDGEYTVNHSSVIYLMDRDGLFLTNYSLEMGPDAIAADLRSRIEASR
jgi:cytochrome oxidase Cu insertion factor (SCO1/SenC/PrrC family)